jgi:hypothetical protein
MICVSGNNQGSAEAKLMCKVIKIRGKKQKNNEQTGN